MPIWHLEGSSLVNSNIKSSPSNSGVNPADHFVVYNEMVTIGSGAERQVDTVRMSPLACYLTVQNADPSKINARDLRIISGFLTIWGVLNLQPIYSGQHRLKTN